MVDSIVEYITIVLSFQIYLDLIQTIYGIHKKISYHITHRAKQ